jgi:hypothetical protein
MIERTRLTIEPIENQSESISLTFKVIRDVITNTAAQIHGAKVNTVSIAITPVKIITIFIS